MYSTRVPGMGSLGSNDILGLLPRKLGLIFQMQRQRRDPKRLARRTSNGGCRRGMASVLKYMPNVKAVLGPGVVDIPRYRRQKTLRGLTLGEFVVIRNNLTDATTRHLVL